MNIYEVLRTKPHSERHLVCYVRFIESRQLKEGPLERHHICPRAKDLFPEYTSFKEHPWNRIDLTPREHYIVHLLLWKTYGGSQTYALRRMRPKNRNYASRSRLGVKLSEETRAKMSIAHRGIPHSPERKAKMSASRIGKKFSDETKAKLRQRCAERKALKNLQLLPSNSST